MAKNKKSPLLGALSTGWNTIFIVVFVVMAIVTLLPVALVFIISFSSTESLETLGYSYFPLGWSAIGYEYIWLSKDTLFQAYWVTIFTSVTGTLLVIALVSSYSYVTNLKSFPYRRFFVWFSFLTGLIGGGLVPEYILMTRYYHLDNTLAILIIPGCLASGSVIVLRTFIRTTVPGALIDSAKIDGAGHFRIYSTIVMPLLKPGLAYIALTTFIGRWSTWFQAALYNFKSDDKLPIMTVLTRIQNNVNFLKTNMQMSPDSAEQLKSLPTENMQMACTVIVMLPILCAYPFFQRYFIQGLTMGSIKE